MHARRRKPGTCAGLRMAAVGVLTPAVVALPMLAQAATGNVLTDRTIADAVDDELLFDPAVLSQSIHVTAREGVVTLTGVTDNILAKERATEVARSVKGVRSVVNAIEVKVPPERRGSDLQSLVVNALRDDPATDAYEINVMSGLDGQITLRGTVDSWQERQLAATVAKGVSGVTRLNNRLDVDFGDGERSDAEIQAEVTRRLQWDVLIDAEALDVAVEDGVVRLSGIVGSATERIRAEKFAYVNGVNKVEVGEVEIHDWAQVPYRRNSVPIYKSDSEVEAAVKDALVYDPRIDAGEVTVAIEDGTATLRGSVASLAAMRSAERNARNTVGVIEVINRIKVAPSGDGSDADVKKRVEAALARDPFVEGHEIAAVVSGGIVKLYGLVDNYHEKSQAEQAVERVSGVIATVNNLGVRDRGMPLVLDPFVSNYPADLYGWYDYRPRVSLRMDHKIRESIEDQLWWSPFVDADEVTVEVVDGRATLTGAVDSFAEWQAAAENAWEGGAVWVDNDLTIQDSQS